MRFLIIRHGDPNYAIDGLTPKGEREAALLTERLAREGVTKIYTSPLGRARATGAPLAARLGIEPVTLDWLREFDVLMDVPFTGRQHLCWNLPPEYWTAKPSFYTPDWRCEPPYAGSDAPARYDEMARGADALLLEHGYRHTGGFFTREADSPETRDTAAIFCHQGAGQILLSLLTGLPFAVFLHTVFLPCTSVSTVFMECWNEEERRYIARAVGIGDVSHLCAGGEPTSFAGLRGTPWTDGQRG